MASAPVPQSERRDVVHEYRGRAPEVDRYVDDHAGDDVQVNVGLLEEVLARRALLEERRIDRSLEPEHRLVVLDGQGKLATANVEEGERRPATLEEELPVGKDAWRVKERERRHEAEEEIHRLCKPAAGQ